MAMNVVVTMAGQDETVKLVSHHRVYIRGTTSRLRSESGASKSDRNGGVPSLKRCL